MLSRETVSPNNSQPRRGMGKHPAVAERFRAVGLGIAGAEALLLVWILQANETGVFGVMVLKVRGSTHEKDIREFMIDGTGMHIGKPFRNVTGILSGFPHQIGTDEMSRLPGLFVEGNASAASA